MEKRTAAKSFASRAAFVALFPITIFGAVCGLICSAWALGYCGHGDGRCKSS